MPVIIAVPQDVTDLVLQGEQMRSSALIQPVNGAPWVSLNVDTLPVALPMVAGAQTTFPMLDHYFVPTEDVFLDATSPMVRRNAVICSPCGAIIDAQPGRTMMGATLSSMVSWLVVGVTRSAGGIPLPFCDVIVLEVGRLTIDGAPVVARATSDANGAYSIPVPTNNAYQVLAFKAGSPNVSGVSATTVTPTAA